ncbi:hypothetical protein FUAX_13580 [Fulvitalea axinellae]|uniref:HYR domain-containing protein n=1 Tax=Fulvitalea axinellae TaxID=1182444 RepID=A0AAU9CJ21_9BACT|nr:hypothetical protein FUAX_13580 [Fulvitalea axinellae]
MPKTRIILFLLFSFCLSFLSFHSKGQGFEYPEGYTYCVPTSVQTIDAKITGVTGGSFSITPQGQGVTVNPQTGSLVLGLNAIPDYYTITYTFTDQGVSIAPIIGDLTDPLGTGDMAAGVGNEANLIYLSTRGTTHKQDGVYLVSLEGSHARLTKKASLPIRLPDGSEHTNIHIALGPPNSNFNSRMFTMNPKGQVGYFDISDNWKFYPLGYVNHGAPQLTFDNDNNLVFANGSYVYKIREDNIHLNGRSFKDYIPSERFRVVDNGKYVSNITGGDVVFDTKGYLYIADNNHSSSIIYKCEYNSTFKRYNVIKKLTVIGGVTGMAINASGCIYYSVQGARELKRVHGLNDCGVPESVSQTVRITERITTADFSFDKPEYCSRDDIAIGKLASESAWGELSSSPAGLVWADQSLCAVNLVDSKPGIYNITNRVKGCDNKVFTKTVTLNISGNPEFETDNTEICETDVADIKSIVPDYDQLVATIDFTVYSDYDLAVRGGSEGRIPLNMLSVGIRYIRGEDRNTKCFSVRRADIFGYYTPEILQITTPPKPVCDGSAIDLTTIKFTSNIIDQKELTQHFYLDASLTMPVPDPENVTVSGTYWMTIEDNLTSCVSEPVSFDAVILEKDKTDFSYPNFCSNTTGRPTLDPNTVRGGTFTFRASSDDNFGNVIGSTTIDPSSGVINNSVPGTQYEVRYSTVSSPQHICPNASTATTTAFALPDASFSYSMGTFCENAGNPTPTITGVPGGNFSAYSVTRKGKIKINSTTGQIDLSQTDPGTYFVVYKVSSNGCENQSETQVTITNSTSPEFSYPQTAYCQKDPKSVAKPSFQGGSAGVFTSSPEGLDIDQSTGIITLKASQPGTYTITNTIPPQSGCSEESATFTLEILESPDVQAKQTIEVCQGEQTVNIADPKYFSGDLTDIRLTFYNKNTGKELPYADGKVIVREGVYLVVATNSESCGEYETMTVMAIPDPELTLVSPPLPTCATETHNLLELNIFFDPKNPDGDDTGNLSYYGDKDDAFKKQNPLTDPSSVPGTPQGKDYFVRADNAEGCFTVIPVTTVTHDRDDPGFVLKDFCEGEDNRAQEIQTPGGRFSFAGLRLLFNADMAEIDPITGMISNGKAGETYQVKYITSTSPENPETGVCPADATNSVSVLENPDLVINNPAPVCAPNKADLSDPAITAGSSAGISVLLYYRTENDARNKTNALTEAEYKAVDANTYYIRAEFPNNCYSIKPVTVTSNPEASLGLGITDDKICVTSTYKVSGVDAINYEQVEWTHNGQGLLEDAETLTPTYVPALNDAGNTVTLTVKLISNQGCTANPTGDIALSVTPLPIVTVISDFTNCSNNPVIELSGTVTNGQPVWTTDGSGSFENSAEATTKYFLSAGDQKATALTFVLTGSSPDKTCSSVSQDLEVTIEQPADPFFTYGQSTFCSGAPNPTPTEITTGGGTFSAQPNGLVVNPASGEINLASSTPGQFTVKYTLPSGSDCPAQIHEVMVTVNETPDATFAYAENSYCKSDGTPVPSAGMIGRITATPEGLVFVDNSTGKIDLEASQPGQYTLTNELSAGGCLAPPKAFALTVNSNPELITNNPAPICMGETIDLTAPDITQGTPNIGSLTLSYYLTEGDALTGSPENLVPDPESVNGGTYYLRAQNNKGCASVKPVTVIQNPLPSFTVSNPEPVCSPLTVDITNTIDSDDASEIYYYNTREDAETDQNRLTTDQAENIPTTGDYFARIITASNCFDIGTISVIVNPKDDPSFVFNNFCFGSDNGPTDITTPGGTFELIGDIPGQATINPTSGHISNAMAGATYSVRYTTNNTCPNDNVEQVTVLEPDDASFTFPDFCFGNAGKPNFVAIPGGTFSLVEDSGTASIDSETGEISNYEASRTYIVQYDTDGAPDSRCPNSTQKSVNVLPESNPSFRIDPFCADNPAPAIILGDTEGSFKFAKEPGDGASINVATGLIRNAVPGSNYLVSYTTPAPCPEEEIKSVSVLPLTDASFRFADFCAGAYNAPTDIATPGGVFSFAKPVENNETIDAITGEIMGAKAGVKYHVQYAVSSSNSSCANQEVREVTAYNVFQSCPENIIINNTNPGSCSAQATWTVPALSPACDNLELTSNYIPGHEFPVGTTTVIYSARLNESEPIATCEFKVTVVDRTPPLLENCGKTLTYRADDNLKFEIPDLKKAMDNCAIETITQDPAMGTEVGIGSYMVALYAKDIAGNETRCMLTLNILPPEGFEIKCPDPLRLVANDDECAAEVPNLIPVFERLNPGFSNVTQTPEAGGLFGIGIFEIMLSAEDALGKKFTCAVATTVGTEPQAVCKDVAVYLDQNGIGDLNPEDVNNGSLSPCIDPDRLEFSVNRTRFHCDDIGETKVTLTVKNEYGFLDQCVTTIFIEDTLSPITRTKEANLYLGEDGTVTLSPSDVNNGSTDNCDRNLELTLDKTDFTCSDIGENTVTLTSKDERDRTSFATAIVNVSDTISPKLTCPPPMDLKVDPENIDLIYKLIEELEPEKTVENCEIKAITKVPGFKVPIAHGDNPVTILAVDQSGNEGRCETVIRVNTGDIVFPPSEDVEVPPGECVAKVPDFKEQIEAENPGSTVESQFPATGAELAIGSHIIVIKGTDASGIAFTFDLTFKVVDKNPPTAKCVGSLTVTLPMSGEATITANDIDDGSFDTCSGVSLSIDKSTFQCEDIGDNTVTLTVTDGSGNKSTCEATILVQPEGGEILKGCPKDKISFNDPGDCGARVFWVEPTLSVPCASITSNFRSGDFFPIGKTKVVYTATAGTETQLCEFEVTVIDNERPTISCSDLVACQEEVTVPKPEVSDNCTIVSLVNDFNGTDDASGKYPIGVTTVNWVVTDSEGLTASCRMTVGVSPEITIKLQDQDSVLLGNSITLRPEVTGADKFRWEPSRYLDDPNIESPTSTPKENITYTVFAWKDGYQTCEKDASVSITVIDELNIPNVFTPDGDGINDYFEIQGINLYPNARLRIFNSVGHRVFESTDVHNQYWGGEKNNKDLPNVSYFYKLELNDNIGTVLTGIITIIR